MYYISLKSPAYAWMKYCSRSKILCQEHMLFKKRTTALIKNLGINISATEVFKGIDQNALQGVNFLRFVTGEGKGLSRAPISGLVSRKMPIASAGMPVIFDGSRSTSMDPNSGRPKLT